MHSLSHTHTYTGKKSSALRCVYVDYLTHTPRAQNQKAIATAMSVVVAALHSLGREAEKKREREGERKVLRERPEST